MIRSNEIVVKIRIDNNVDALKTIQALKAIDGYKGMSFYFKEK